MRTWTDLSSSSSSASSSSSEEIESDWPNTEDDECTRNVIHSFEGGIRNTTGVACHLSAALILLHYAYNDLSRVLQQQYASSDKSDNTLLISLGRTLECIQNNAENGISQDGPVTAIDPTHLYQLLSEDVGISVDNLCDTTTTWIKLVNYLTSVFVSDDNNNNNDNDHAALTDDEVIDSVKVQVYRHFRASTTYYTLQQLMIDTEDNTRLIHRERRLNRQSIACPWPLGDLRYMSLVDALSASIQAQQIHNYVWKHPYDERYVDNTGIDASDTYLQTTRKITIEQLPPVWLLSTSYNTHDGPLRKTLDVPSSFYISNGSNDRVVTAVAYDVDENGNNDNNNNDDERYLLVAAILYALSYSEDSCDGHVMTIVRYNKHTQDEKYEHQWLLYNDDTVNIMSHGSAMNFVCGREYKDDDDDSKVWTQAIVLAYKRVC